MRRRAADGAHPAEVSEHPTAAGSGTRATALLRGVLPGAADLCKYQLRWLRPDLLAGLAVWAILVPQGLTYGELAGLSPVTGLYTALGALLLYALVGSSRHLHVGPDSSVAIVTAAYIGGLVAAHRNVPHRWLPRSHWSRRGSCWWKRR